MKKRIRLQDVEILSKYNKNIDIDNLHIFEFDSGILDYYTKKDFILTIEKLKKLNLNLYFDNSYFYFINNSFVIFFHIDKLCDFIYSFEKFSIQYINEIKKHKDNSLYKKTLFNYFTLYSKIDKKVVSSLIKQLLAENLFSYSILSIDNGIGIEYVNEEISFYFKITNKFNFTQVISELVMTNSLDHRIIKISNFTNINEPLLTLFKIYGINSKKINKQSIALLQLQLY